MEPSLCLDYSAERQAFGIWGCATATDAPQGLTQEQPSPVVPASALFAYHRIGEKYCLRRGHGSTCVQQAVLGSAIHLRMPADTGDAAETLACVEHLGKGATAAAAACSGSVSAQQWIFHAPSASFRPAEDPSACLQLRIDASALGGK